MLKEETWKSFLTLKDQNQDIPFPTLRILVMSSRFQTLSLEASTWGKVNVNTSPLKCKHIFRSGACWGCAWKFVKEWSFWPARSVFTAIWRLETSWWQLISRWKSPTLALPGNCYFFKIFSKTHFSFIILGRCRPIITGEGLPENFRSNGGLRNLFWRGYRQRNQVMFIWLVFANI